MNQIDIIFVISLLVTGLIGYLLGFGKSLKVATKGVFGIIISVYICMVFGGRIMKIAVIGEFVANVNAYFSGLWSFLKYLNLGVVIFYACLFFAVQLMRVIIVKILSKIGDTDNLAVKVVNKVLGAVFFAGFCLSLCLLFFAVLKVFDGTEFVKDLLLKLDDGLLKTLYEKNPIIF